jgi:hypothetical protein
VAKLNKKQILLNLITPPKSIKGAFWSREYKILKNLMADYPSEDFWQKVHFNMGWDSIVILQTDYGKSLLDQKYKSFHYKIPEYKNITLTNKSGSDKIVSKKNKTIRGFLNE